MIKKGFFKKRDYVYDVYYDCYICPNHKILSYSTTNREGYQVYKSNLVDCANCPLIQQCTEAKNKTKIVMRLYGQRIWKSAKQFGYLLA